MSTPDTPTDHSAWIAQLLERYAQVVHAIPSPEPEQLFALHTLQLADAVLSKLELLKHQPIECQQFAVIGPTQSGKSTLVNLLLDCNAASVSALAGFTVHAQGYASDLQDTELASLETLMAPLQRTPASELDAEYLDTYVLEPVTPGTHAIVNHGVVWDTPDFDSIDSSSYQRAVLRTIGIADSLILTVSKDKYGDKTVWNMLALLHTLQRPLLVCINKLDEADQETVLNAFKRRFSELFDTPPPPIVTLPFVRKTALNTPAVLPPATLSQLSEAMRQLHKPIDQQSLSNSINAFIDTHQNQWLTPLIRERHAQFEWYEFVASLIDEAEQRYRNGYLNNPDKYDTFNRALAELLTLLEIPGIAPALTRTRQAVTWPARKLLGLGRSAIGKRLNRSNGRAETEQTPDQEADTLQGILDHTLITAQRKLLEQTQTDDYWMAMNQALRQREMSIRERYQLQCQQAREEFEPHIDAAAQRLYEQLQSQPALLNTLRATRATADAAGVALALKSGGLAPADLILAPAMFSVTTLLTESALGSYLDSVKRELREQQGKHIHARILQGVLATELSALSTNLDNTTLFSQHLEPELEQVLNKAV